MVLGSNYSVKQSVPALVTMLIAIVVAVISTNTFAGDGNRCSSAEKMKARWTTADGTCTKRGMLLFYSPGADMKGHFVKASLGTLEEIDVNGRVIKKVKLGHRRPNIINDYVFSTEVWQINYSLTPELMAKQKTRFGREGFQARFNRTMHFGTLTSSITESAECPLCASGTSGSCQNAATKACASPNTATDRCPRRFSPCTTTFLVYPNVLSVSYEVEDWPFSSPDNTLRYSMGVHAKTDSKVNPSD
jgi:hypothetical protein